MIYIPYGYSMMKLGKTNLSFEFARNLYLLIADCEYSHNYFLKTNKINVKCKIQKSVDFGFPYFDDLIRHKEKYLIGNDAFGQFNKSRINVIWTPRWTISDGLGGSNFFRYIDKMFSYLINNKEYNFVFRPHPMAFDNYVKTGLLSVDEKKQYLKQIELSENSVYDKENDYLNTINSCDVMITDVSSIIPEAMILRKPIIFCHNSGKEVLNDFAKKCCENVFYNAYCFDDIINYLDNIKNGLDPIKEKKK